MSYLPIFIDITDRPILIVGGGRIAWQKLSMLKGFTDKLTIIAKQIDERIKQTGVPYREKEFEPGDLAGFWLIYACTNSVEVNRQIKQAAGKAGLLVNVTDNKSLCDFITPAIYKKDYMTVAVSSGGENLKRAIRWRDRIKEYLKDDPAYLD